MSKIKSNYNSLLIEALSAKPIAFNPLLAEASSSAGAGLFLSQLLYWWNKGSSKDEIYKTIQEVYLETRLTRSEQTRAIEIWKDLEVLQVTLKGLPRRRFFKIDINKLELIVRTRCARNMLTSTRQSVKYGRQADRTQLAIAESTPENANRNLVKHTSKLSEHNLADE